MSNDPIMQGMDLYFKSEAMRRADELESLKMASAIRDQMSFKNLATQFADPTSPLTRAFGSNAPVVAALINTQNKSLMDMADKFAPTIKPSDDGFYQVAPNQPAVHMGGLQKERQLDNTMETAFLQHYPTYLSSRETRQEAYNRYSSDPEFRNAIDSKMAQLAQSRVPIVYNVAGYTPGGKKIVTTSNRVGKDGKIEVVTSEVPGSGVVDKPGDITPAVQENLQGGVNAWRSLNYMEPYVKNQVNLPIVGKASEFGAWLGVSPEAQRFKAAWNNMRLSAQSLVKGIPSNYDVSTVLETLPNFGESKTMNIEKIKQSRETIKNLMESTIAYHMGANHYVPPLYLQQAKAMGIDVNKIQPWNPDSGQDPLERVFNPKAGRGTKPVAPNSTTQGFNLSFPPGTSRTDIVKSLRDQGVNENQIGTLADKIVTQQKNVNSQRKYRILKVGD